MLQPIIWENNQLKLLDQTLLPGCQRHIVCKDYREVAQAIREMKVRGAPAIGVAAAYGMALAARAIGRTDRTGFLLGLRKAAAELRSTRPTAVNLMWALDRILQLAERTEDWRQLPELITAAACRMEEEDVQANRRLGKLGARLLPDEVRVLTHCNAGALATAGYGTALGVIRAAREMGKKVAVYADETRPYLQGARLTALELVEDGFPVTLITDSMAGHVLQKGLVNCVVVGADRIAANGDTANKIGTYSVAVLARENNVPFYVAAPVSTLDLDLPDGDHIPIEERDPKEITEFLGSRIAPAGVSVYNPSFDVTPARYITAIITDRGVAFPPYTRSLKTLQAEQGTGT